MNTKKSKTLPIIITIIFIMIIVYLFMNIKQTTISCKKVKTFDSDIQLTETITSLMDNNRRINHIEVTKKITVPEKHPKREQALKGIKNAVEKTLEYLGDKATVEVDSNSVFVHIVVENKELVLLDNINIIDNNGEISVEIDVNTKSSNVVSLQVGDTYSDGELLTHLKNNGYSCQ